MKKFYLFIWTVIISAVLFQTTYAQTPQYYNTTASGIGNTLPFGSLAATGYKTQWLIGPNEYIQPSPAPAGNITKFYIYISQSGSGTYTQFTLKMGQAAISTFATGTQYSGQLNTVYYNASASFSAVSGAWFAITLDSVFAYNPALGLIIEASHCGISGSGFNVYQSAGTTGIIRRNNIPGTPSCVFTYSGQDTRTLQCGVDISVPIGIENRNNTVPAGYKLAQNYPNPFNPFTTIEFSVPATGYTELKVYNILGNETAVLLSELITAGTYSISFDASGLPSGSYFYRLTSGDYSASKKMLFIK